MGAFLLQYAEYDSNWHTYGAYASEEDAEKAREISVADNPWYHTKQWRTNPLSVQTVSEEEYEMALAFNRAKDFDWSHRYSYDSGLGAILRRHTCTRCGSSVIQYRDGVIEKTGSADQQCPEDK